MATRLQLQRNEWWEAKRHNAAQEAEQYRHNLAQEEATREANAISRQAQEETARSNRAKEEISRSELAIREEQTQETVRSNLARETENLRHNSATERMDRVANRMNNSREWAKIGLTEQRNSVMNAKDAAETQLKNAEALLKKAELDAGLPQARVKEIEQSLKLEREKFEESKNQFQTTSKFKERELTVAEKRQRSDEMLNSAKDFKTILEGTNEALKFLSVVLA
jgi:hypothetical protein